MLPVGQTAIGSPTEKECDKKRAKKRGRKNKNQLIEITFAMRDKLMSD